MCNSDKNRKYHDIKDKLLQKANKSLKAVNENNPYHSNQEVLAHTVSVNNNLDSLLDGEFIIDPIVKDRFKEYFSEMIGDLTKAELLSIATIVHDFGKPKTLTFKDNGDTSCIDHAKIGAEIAYEDVKKQGLSEEQANYVKNVVARHMDVFNLHGNLSNAKDPTKTFNKAKEKLGDLYVDVLVHTVADLQGCQKRADYQPTPITFDGKTFETDVQFIQYLIEDAMLVKEVTGPITELESLTQKGTVYLPSDTKGMVNQTLTEHYSAQMQGKVDSGKISAEKLSEIVEKKVNTIMSTLRFGQPPQDYKAIIAENPIAYQPMQN